MGHIQVNLPETLHRQIENIAQKESVSLSQYVIYALTRQITMGYTVQPVFEKELREQKADFEKTVESLGPPASSEKMRQFMAVREIGEPERELPPEVVRRLQKKISDQAQFGEKS